MFSECWEEIRNTEREFGEFQIISFSISDEEDLERSERDKKLFKKMQTLEERLEDTELDKRKVSEEMSLQNETCNPRPFGKIF